MSVTVPERWLPVLGANPMSLYSASNLYPAFLVLICYIQTELSNFFPPTKLGGRPSDFGLENEERWN